MESWKRWLPLRQDIWDWEPQADSADGIKTESCATKNMGMERLLHVMNQLQEIFKMGTGEISLPMIIVVGAQNTGKSSVLESFVGKPFLPRGDGMVTRCPITIQLIHTENRPKDYWEFEIDGQDKYTDAEKVCEAIKKRTNELLLEGGEKRSISETPIIVKVFSSNVVTLTVVDLPGLVKNAMEGQPKEVVDKIRQLVLSKAKEPNSIILAIHPATDDIANSESMQLAQEVDSELKRTILVVTKVDCMGAGTDARKLLCERLSFGGTPLKYASIGVINRSQKDIEMNKTFEEVYGYEERFFRSHYPFLRDACGSRYLAVTLNQILLHHIQDALPNLKVQIMSKIEQCEANQKTFGVPLVNIVEQKVALNKAIHTFIDEFERCIMEPSSNNDSTKQFAAEIAWIHAFYSDKIRLLDVADDLEASISNELKESVTIELRTNIEKTYKKLAKVNIMKLDVIWKDAAQLYFDVLVKAIKQNLRMIPWVKLRVEMQRVSLEILERQLKLTKESIEKEMKIHTGINISSDEEFLKLLKIHDNVHDFEEIGDEALDYAGLPSVPKQNKIPENVNHALMNVVTKNNIQSKYSYQAGSCPMSTLSDLRLSVNYTKRLIIAYCKVVQGQISDYLPKHLFFHLLKETIENLRTRMVEKCQGKEGILMTETPDTMKKRIENEEDLKKFQRAKETIDRLQEPDEDDF